MQSTTLVKAKSDDGVSFLGDIDRKMRRNAPMQSPRTMDDPVPKRTGDAARPQRNFIPLLPKQTDETIILDLVNRLRDAPGNEE